MSAEKVARLLTDFDRPEPSKNPGRIVPFDHALHSSAKTQPRPVPVPTQPAPRADDGYQRGLSEGYAAARAEYEQKLSEERDRLGARFGDERQHLLNEIAVKITNDIAEAGHQLEAKIAGVTARILEPLVSSIVQRQAVANFVDKLSSLISDSRRPVIRIAGPADLIELVRSKLGVSTITVELRSEAAVEVSVTVEQVFLETQVKVWADRLKFAVLT